MVVQKIQYLVGNGILSVNEMRRHLREYLANDLFCGQELLPTYNRRTFRPKRTYTITSTGLWCKTDFQNVTTLMCLWKFVSGRGNINRTRFTFAPMQQDRVRQKVILLCLIVLMSKVIITMTKKLNWLVTPANSLFSFSTKPPGKEDFSRNMATTSACWMQPIAPPGTHCHYSSWLLKLM